MRPIGERMVTKQEARLLLNLLANRWECSGFQRPRRFGGAFDAAERLWCGGLTGWHAPAFPSFVVAITPAGRDALASWLLRGVRL